MAGLDTSTPLPTEIKLHQASRVLEVTFSNGRTLRLPCEFLRVHSPSAEVRGHGPGQETLQVGKRDVTIAEPRAGRPLRSAAHVLRRSRIGDLFVGLPVRPGRAPGRIVAALPGAPRGRRREPRSRVITSLDERIDALRLRAGPARREDAPRARRVRLGRAALRPDERPDVGGNAPAVEALRGRRAGVREGSRVLDLASGTGDLARQFAERAGATGCVIHTDINGAMLAAGRDRLLDTRDRASRPCNATPRRCRSRRAFDCVSIAFGLRNVTRKERALAEMRRVLRPGGIALVLEFSRVAAPLRARVRLVQLQRATAAGQARRGRRGELSLSRRIDPRASGPGGAEELMERAGFDAVDYHNLAAGVVALHVGRVY